MALGAGGCASGIDDGRTDPESERMHLGRVHVLLEPAEDDTAEGAPGSFEVTARFAWVRGIDEDLARTRIDMPVLPHEILRPGECTPTDQLGASTELDPESSEVPELVLLDAGDLVVGVGDDRVRVPLSLVPDLLPYMSGVEYLYYGEDLPILPDEGGAPLSVLASGSQTDELPPFSADGTVPGALALGMTDDELAELAKNALVLHWRPEGELLTLRIQGLVGGEPRGAELTCIVADEGRARFDLQNLHGLGLTAEADGLRVVASRVQATTFDAGDFTGSELVIERREQLVVGN
jgi:hypothetical protein